MLPNFLIVGAAKAGTTSLYHYLGQHPEIGFPMLKEPKFFSSLGLQFPHNGHGDAFVDQHAVRSFPEYQACFNDLSHFKRIGEASPDYLFFYQHSVPNIVNTLGDLPIIIVLRNPTRRAFSAYSYLVRDSRENLSFMDALNVEDARAKKNWDFIWQYKRGGLYADQVRAYLEAFSRVKVVFFDDLVRDKERVVHELFTFLGVEPNFKPNLSVEYNPSGIPSNSITKYLLNRKNSRSVYIRELLKKSLPRSVLELVAKKSLKKVVMANYEIEYLNDYYAEEIKKLEQLLGRALNNWVTRSA